MVLIVYKKCFGKDLVPTAILQEEALISDNIFGRVPSID